ncbi:hypothetical protein [Ferdinandcohnia sp. SAFN-114]|uniref:hypothetical protein n=1 Tax=Ferdinandcohnia sp. SAFN-114 TaxID=3387275 RepID=UPI003F81643C
MVITAILINIASNMLQVVAPGLGQDCEEGIVPSFLIICFIALNSNLTDNFKYVVMIMHNMVFRELWAKWTNRD